MKQSTAYLLFACIGFVGACGSAASADYELPTAKADPLLTLYGQITSADRGVMTTGTRAAFVWFPASPGAGVQVSQDLGRPLMMDLIKMAISVAQVPPMYAEETATRQAELVFYLDGNGNNKLDIYAPGDTSPDRVVGRAPDARIVWGTGRSTDTTKAQPIQKSAGRVCTKEAPDYSLVCGMDDHDPGLAPSSPIPVQFLNEGVLGAYTCAGFWGSQQWLEGDPHLSADLRRQICNRCGSTSDESALGGEGSCRWEPTSSGGWRACVDDPSLCGTTFCHVAVGPYVPGQSDCL